MMDKPIRVILAKPTQDCHDRGVRYLARRLRDAGFEVLFMNFLLPEEVVQATLQEDVDAIGISTSSGGHLPVFEDLLSGLRRERLDHVVVVAGGVIPSNHADTLKEWGVEAVFGPGSTAQEAVQFLRDRIERREEASP